MKFLRFRCRDCGLQMALHEKPEKCFDCGSTDIVREGWRQRYSRSKSDSGKDKRS